MRKTFAAIVAVAAVGLMAGNASATTVVVDLVPNGSDGDLAVFGNFGNLYGPNIDENIYVKVEFTDVTPSGAYDGGIDVNFTYDWNYYVDGFGHYGRVTEFCGVSNGCLHVSGGFAAGVITPDEFIRPGGFDFAYRDRFTGIYLNATGLVTGDSPSMRFSLSSDPFPENALVPEPATWGLMLMGLGGIGGVIRSRRKHLASQPLKFGRA